MLSDNQIRNLVDNGDLDIINADLDEQLNSASVDLSVGSDYLRPATQEVFDARSMNNGQIVLKPGEFYHLHTTESIVLPDNIQGTTDPVMGRSLNGIFVMTGVIEPGFEGKLMFPVVNLSETYKTLTPGDTILQIKFDMLDERPDQTYEGDTYFERGMKDQNNNTSE